MNEGNGEIKMSSDLINNPKHYTSHPSGVECIEVAEHMSFCIGNAIKYLWRNGLKGNSIEDLKKARWYIDREILRQELLIELDVKATRKGQLEDNL